MKQTHPTHGQNFAQKVQASHLEGVGGLLANGEETLLVAGIGRVRDQLTKEDVFFAVCMAGNDMLNSFHPALDDHASTEQHHHHGKFPGRILIELLAMQFPHTRQKHGQGMRACKGIEPVQRIDNNVHDARDLGLEFELLWL
jgi:hypothetical protein